MWPAHCVRKTRTEFTGSRLVVRSGEVIRYTDRRERKREGGREGEREREREREGERVREIDRKSVV